MKYNKIKSVFAIVLCTLISCQSNLHEERTEFNPEKWEQGKEISFNFDNKEGEAHDVFVSIQHTFGTVSPNIELYTAYNTPEGKVGAEVTKIVLREGEDHKGSCTGDYCDFDQKVLTLPAKKGNITVKVAPSDDIVNILSVKLYVK